MFKLKRTPPLIDLARMAWHRFHEVRCLQIGSSLTFTALLAIVPIITVALTLISAFPVFRDLMQNVQQFLVANMLPESAENITSYTQQFADNAARLTAVGIAFLFVTAMIVLNTIGIPPGGIAIVLGVDRILDMCRTVPNVTGDLTAACFIARSESVRQAPVPDRAVSPTL